MSPSLKTLLKVFLTLTLYLCSLTSTKSRPIDFSHTESSTLVTRLNSGSNSTSCWDSLFKLQACTGEVIQFFYNGKTYLGPECCQEVQVIVHDCFPGLLSSLGFTSEEGDILRGYCDAEVNRPGPIAPRPPHPVIPSQAEPIEDQD